MFVIGLSPRLADPEVRIHTVVLYIHVHVMYSVHTVILYIMYSIHTVLLYNVQYTHCITV